MNPTFRRFGCIEGAETLVFDEIVTTRAHPIIIAGSLAGAVTHFEVLPYLTKLGGCR
ncbi:hypothetical protein D3C72_2428170 [compost metagenome]